MTSFWAADRLYPGSLHIHPLGTAFPFICVFCNTQIEGEDFSLLVVAVSDRSLAMVARVPAELDENGRWCFYQVSHLSCVPAGYKVEDLRGEGLRGLP